MKIAVLSDTHGLLRPEVLRLIGESDAVIHGGDINSQKIIDEMKAAAKPGTPFYIVRGNNDKEWAEYLPHHLEFTLAGIRFYVVHNKKELPEDLGDRQIIIFGHSHKYLEEERDSRLWLNPGSCGRRRFNQDITMAVLEIREDEETCTESGDETPVWSVERIDIPHEKGAGRPADRSADRPGERQESSSGKSEEDRDVRIPDGDLLGVITKILRRMDKGQQVGKIAADMGLDQKFVEQVCRIRVTHPGVTAHGILDKMEVNRTGR